MNKAVDFSLNISTELSSYLSLETIKEALLNHWKNSYGRIYLTVEPFVQASERSNMLLFLWGHLLGEHRGEPLEVNLIRSKNTEGSENWHFVDHWLKVVRREVYIRLRFTKVQRTIIKSLAQQQKNVAEIAHDLQLSIRTVEGHCRNILVHARRVFQEPEFRTAQEVVAYIKSQHFLD